MRWNRNLYRLYRSAPVPPADATLEPALPYANGWYLAALSHHVTPHRPLAVRIAQEDLLLTRTSNGTVRALRPYCPHLGAHLGVMGTYQKGQVRCGFHGMTFDLTDGSCVASPYGRTKGRLALLPAHESGAAVWVWYSQAGTPPYFDVPDMSTTGWSTPVAATFDIATHPQIIMENAVDEQHFVHLHRFTHPPGEITYCGPTIKLKLRLDRSLPFGYDFRLLFDGEIHGLGLGLSNFLFPDGSRVRLIISAVPIAPWRTRFWITHSAKLKSGPASRPASWLAARIMQALVCNDVHADLPVWHFQRYQHPPRLSAGDGPIGPYRQWAQQFYEGGASSKDLQSGH
ncbi:Rieske 2Fe-2S domain-containing protein [Streptomyces sp. ET3-23]|uniref:aromatic ring-hydroxylating oxygenase subunit alpha n=1 Tax=Streptomyces sp. ET3-23 TaxID=2885643 RepID=UPI001D1004F9|nr:Rieske 2Fe-2S domain-containing protein [Streptomyces sp. ET3-23]MCC2280978.1 Rieske 2Fe-2S domain-containing protein [Streptomyces sp. ET3-23]